MSTKLFSRSSYRCYPMGFLLVCFVLLLPTGTLAAQNYIQTQVDKKMAKTVRTTTINDMLREGFKKPNSEAIFDEYYKKCVFPEWTDPANFSTHGKQAKSLRRRIIKDLDRAGKGPVYDHFNQLILDQMLEFVKGNYHPATRFNAMLLIGELNTEKPGFNKSPDPLPKALPILLAAVQDDSLPGGVRFAGLLGVVRHSKYGAKDKKDREKIDKLLLSLVAMRDVPAGRSKAGHGWFRRIAMDTLARRGSPGPNGIAAKAVASVIGESDAPLSVRCDAAEDLGWFRLRSDTGVNPDAVASMLKDLFKAVANEEIEQAEEDKEYVINASKTKARIAAILAAITGSKDRDNNDGKGVMALVPNPDDAKLLRSLQRDLEELLGRKYLDHEDLKPKSETASDRRDPFAGRGGGRRPRSGRGGLPGEDPMAGGPEGPQPGLLGQAETNPAKPISDEIIGKLIELVKKYDAY